MNKIISVLLAMILGVGVVGGGNAARAATSEAAPLDSTSAPRKPAAQAQSTAPAKPGSNAARYAERERQAGDAQNFRGGSASIYIGGSALTIALVILLLIIIL